MNSRSLFSQTLVVAEESSSVTILESIESGDDGVDGDRYFSNLVEIVAGENANVQFGSLQNLDDDSYTYSLKRGVTDTYATVDWIESNFGSKLTRSDVETELNGDGSEPDRRDVLRHRRPALRHQRPRLAPGRAHDGRPRHARRTRRRVPLRLRGVQDVGEDAWNTSSYQRENTLMLSDDAEADASPKLIIHNHDTEASHSATVGQVDAEDLFYRESNDRPADGPKHARRGLLRARVRGNRSRRVPRRRPRTRLTAPPVS